MDNSMAEPMAVSADAAKADADERYSDEAYVLLHAASLTMEQHRLDKTTKLSLKGAGIHVLPPSIALLTELKHLDISLNPLDALPSEIGKLSGLRILFTLGCQFRSIPSVLGTLPSLSMLSFKSNQLEIIAEDALAPTLRWLILTDNKLRVLPASIGKLRGLQKLMLTNNQLASLPDELLQCSELEMIRASDNQLASLPGGLLDMPSLAWLALAGNPCVELATAATTAPPPRQVRVEELLLGDILGGGAGGTVYRSMWASAPEDPPVAVKLFKEAATVSDGDPTHEVHAAGVMHQQNMIRVLATVAPPSLGLVQELLSGYSTLGNPPDFGTCTRDTYDASVSFAAEFVLRALRGVAAACAHLHAAQYMHGDLYAHNIMVTGEGEPKVGDFGASFCYSSLPTPAVQAIEVRAFGILALELVERMTGGAAGPLGASLTTFAQRCIGPIKERPMFEAAAEELGQLSA